jgi:hypothetical protein
VKERGKQGQSHPQQTPNTLRSPQELLHTQLNRGAGQYRHPPLSHLSPGAPPEVALAWFYLVLWATQALPSRWFLSLERQRQETHTELPQLGILSSTSWSKALLRPPSCGNLAIFTPTHSTEGILLWATFVSKPKQGPSAGSPQVHSDIQDALGRGHTGQCYSDPRPGKKASGRTSCLRSCGCCFSSVFSTEGSVGP